MPLRVITSPGVEIREIDKSGYTTVPTGTSVYLKGFTSKGEPYRPMEITTRSAFEQIYGAPDNEAERYTYAAACETLNQGGRLWMARLPYDNKSFEKMVGIKYKVNYSDSDITDSSVYNVITEADNEITKAAFIEGGKDPITYDLSTIYEYRADEAKVPANTFLIVDTTGATYNRVTEDSRKGENREVIGIVPVVTTAANALYVQSLISVGLQDIYHYEPLNHDYLKTLKTSEFSNAGLSSTDVVVQFNTKGAFNLISDEQKLSTKFVGSLKDYPTLDMAYSHAVSQFSTWGEEISAVDSKYILDSISCDKDTGLILVETDGNSMTPEQITTLNDLGKATQKLVDYYEAHYPINTLGNIAVALYKLSVDHGNTIPYDLTASLHNDTINDFVNIAIELMEGANISVSWYATFKYRDALNKPYFESEQIPQTQSLDAAAFFPTIQPASEGGGFDPEHLKDIGVVVYKMYLDPAEGNKVSYEAVEAYAGSLYKDDKDPNTGVTKFIDTIINSQSNYINFFSNCFSTTAAKEFYLKDCDILIATPSDGASLGFYTSMTAKDISISKSILDGMNKCFDQVEDINKLDIDIVPDAGLANIASYIKAIFGDKGPYDLTITDDIGNSLLKMWKCKKATDDPVKMWKTIEMKHDNFCKNIRKDCMFIADGLRPLVLEGQKKIVRDTKPINSIDKDILPFVPAICGLNTNYGAGYLDWFEQADDYTGDFFWCPPSIKAMGIYINTDLNFEYWDAPAGLNRGVVAATDVAFSPNGRQAGSIYEKNWNYAINYPQDGIVLEGQKTFQTKPSALDRVNVRRTMLRLERQVYKTVRYFVYENNTAYTRQRVVDAIEPIMKACWKSGNGGINRYKIVCDDKINDANTIDNNELKVQIGIVPNKSAEFILVDFVLGNQSSTWAELLG